MEKTITTPTTKNPLTGERVGKGEPTEKDHKRASRRNRTLWR